MAASPHSDPHLDSDYGKFIKHSCNSLSMTSISCMDCIGVQHVPKHNSQQPGLRGPACANMQRHGPRLFGSANGALSLKQFALSWQSIFMGLPGARVNPWQVMLGQERLTDTARRLRYKAKNALSPHVHRREVALSQQQWTIANGLSR